MKKKFADSFNGLKLALKHRAVMVQFILGLMALIGGFIIRLDHYEWLAFIICIAMVITAEIINTAIEKIGDYLNSEYDERIKTIKDLSSGGVLVASLGALAVCILCVIERILK
ncbi:MAG: diacylglycerol kinase [Erysipelotrichaceae bacterium]|nr:diacylglycerol kinase [Erysipelotrichaceae bacterium]MCR5096828.1 diacylglycerol kinase [Erysipelotrichaceae bacterium]